MLMKDSLFVERFGCVWRRFRARWLGRCGLRTRSNSVTMAGQFPGDKLQAT